MEFLFILFNHCMTLRLIFCVYAIECKVIFGIYVCLTIWKYVISMDLTDVLIDIFIILKFCMQPRSTLLYVKRCLELLLDSTYYHTTFRIVKRKFEYVLLEKRLSVLCRANWIWIFQKFQTVKQTCLCATNRYDNWRARYSRKREACLSNQRNWMCALHSTKSVVRIQAPHSTESVVRIQTILSGTILTIPVLSSSVFVKSKTVDTFILIIIMI